MVEIEFLGFHNNAMTMKTDEDMLSLWVQTCRFTSFHKLCFCAVLPHKVSVYYAFEIKLR